MAMSDDTRATPGRGPQQLRQGDVLLHPVAEIPAEARPLPRTAGRVVLAEGEATGHAHAIAADGATLLGREADRFLRVVRPVVLNHEEHAALDVAPGLYRVVIQREYVPPEVEPAGQRRVVD